MNNTCNHAEGSQNPEKQPTLVPGQQPNGKSRLNIGMAEHVNDD
jgi:hypothetical protein